MVIQNRHTRRPFNADCNDVLLSVHQREQMPCPAVALHAFASSLNAPLTLAELGMAEADLDRAADIAAQNAYWNPAPLNRDGIRRLLDDAFHGRAPSTSGRVPG